MGSRFLVLQAGDHELAKSQCIAMKGESDKNQCFEHALIDANFLRIPKCGNQPKERKMKRLKYLCCIEMKIETKCYMNLGNLTDKLRPQRGISKCFVKARNAVQASHANSRGSSGKNLEMPGYCQHFKLNRYFNQNFYVVLLINGCTGNNYFTINSKSRIGSTISLTQLRLSRICLELEI